MIVQRLIIDLNTIDVATKVNDCFSLKIEETDNDVWVLQPSELSLISFVPRNGTVLMGFISLPF